MNKKKEQAIVCDVTAIPAKVREQHLASIPEIFQAAQDIQELPNGYAFKFQNEPERFKTLANFIEYEQLCCPFEGLAVEVEPYSGPIWLRLTGGEGYKEAFAAGLRDMRHAADDIQREPDDKDTLQAMVNQIAPTMADLMEKATPLSNEN